MLWTSVLSGMSQVVSHNENEVRDGGGKGKEAVWVAGVQGRNIVRSGQFWGS